MKLPIKIWVVCCILMQVPLLVHGADTLKINLIYKHKIDKGGHTQGYMTINQQFFTPEGIKFREINYNENDGQIHSYIFFFYNDNKLSTEECYNQKDSLVYILKHTYDVNGRDVAVLRFEPSGNSLKQTGKTTYRYDKAGRMVSKKIYLGKSVVSSSSSKYDANGNLLQESNKYKGQAVKSERRISESGINGKTNKVMVTGKNSAGKTFRRTEAYAYDDAGRVGTITVVGSDLPEGLIKTYKYLPSGRISLYEESNSAGIFTLILQYDYKKHLMDMGTQVSYFNKGK